MSIFITGVMRVEDLQIRGLLRHSFLTSRNDGLQPWLFVQAVSYASAVFPSFSISSVVGRSLRSFKSNTSKNCLVVA